MNKMRKFSYFYITYCLYPGSILSFGFLEILKLIIDCHFSVMFHALLVSC